LAPLHPLEMNVRNRWNLENTASFNVVAEIVFPPKPVAVIPLPDEVAQATGFNHLMINWEPHGHPPALFAVSHFDFHFYTVDPAVVTAIDCRDAGKPAQLPAGYSLPDIAIPGTLSSTTTPGS
jgi:hypothetical protein